MYKPIHTELYCEEEKAMNLETVSSPSHHIADPKFSPSDSEYASSEVKSGQWRFPVQIKSQISVESFRVFQF